MALKAVKRKTHEREKRGEKKRGHEEKKTGKGCGQKYNQTDVKGTGHRN